MVSIRLFLRLLQLRYHLPAQAVLEGRQGDFSNVSNRLTYSKGLRSHLQAVLLNRRGDPVAAINRLRAQKGLRLLLCLQQLLQGDFTQRVALMTR